MGSRVRDWIRDLSIAGGWIATGGLVGWVLPFRLPFFFALVLVVLGRGVMSATEASQLPFGMAVRMESSARGASHSELCGEGSSSDESRFCGRKKGKENLRRFLVD